MATIKSYTDRSQSKKLAKILPIESADMVIWGRDLDAVATTDAQKFISGLKDRKMNYLPCWSLAALLGILPVTATLLKDGNISNTGDIKYNCESSMININKWFDNPVDVCVAMIEKLHELKML